MRPQKLRFERGAVPSRSGVKFCHKLSAVTPKVMVVAAAFAELEDFHGARRGL